MSSIYMNIPVQLLEGFIHNHEQRLSNMLDFAFYEKAYSLSDGEPKQWHFDESRTFYNFTTTREPQMKQIGKTLFNSLPKNSPRFGLQMRIYWDYYKNPKTEEELVNLMAFLALKSIIQDAPYKKITKGFWFGRMAGRTNAIKSVNELPYELQKYYSNYYRLKIKETLAIGWGLKYPKVNARGFYASFKLNIDVLTKHAISKQKSTKIKAFKEAQNEALRNARN